MKLITFDVSGSVGDVAPLIPLASALAEEGYQIRFVCPSLYKGMVEAAGLPYHSALENGDPRKVQQDDYAARSSGRIAFFAKYFRGCTPNPASLRGHVDASQSADLLVCNTVTSASYHVAESRKIPCVMVYYSPSYSSRYFPAPIGPQHMRLGPLYNLGTHWLMQQMFWKTSKQWINDWRENDLGLARVSFRQLRQKQRENLIRLFAFSKHIAPEARDWPENNRISGFFWPKEAGFKPDSIVARFFEDGPPPVFVGFGSVCFPNLKRLLEQIRQALTKAHARGVFVGGWGGLEDSESDHQFLYTDFLPYRWLFPRISLAIHAAGCGTTAELLRAGVPSIPVPFAGEQKFWAERLCRIGAALKVVRPDDVDVDTLSKLMHRSLNDTEMKLRISEIRKKVSGEDGVREAVALIKTLLNDSSRVHAGVF